MAVEKYFTWNAPPRIGAYNSPTWGLVRWRELSLPRAQQLWEQGCPYLSLTHAGAELLYSDARVHELRALCLQCRTLPELEAIAALRPDSPTLVRAVEERRHTLTASA